MNWIRRQFAVWPSWALVVFIILDVVVIVALLAALHRVLS